MSRPKSRGKVVHAREAGEFRPPDTDPAAAHYVFRLYVTGLTPRSSTAIANAKALCETHLAGRYDLEVIDVLQQPEKLREIQIIALPTLIKEFPPPQRRIVGDLADTQSVLLALAIKPET